ncbi:MAG: YdbL family protein [Gemmatimonadetes bacterium]|nr:YdbL family protein [Gemmatimonadota bacterium]
MLRRNFARAMVLAATVLVLGLSGPPALAQSLDQLRASGAVGERYDGYAEALQSGAAGVVQQVNAKRRQIYQQTADKEGASVDQIGRIYARQIFAKAPPGTKFLQENGSWVTK